jgi:hypothetical protein
MATVDKLLSAMRADPSKVRYAEACRVADHFFGAARQTGTSHRVWKMPWPGDPRVNMQLGDGGMAKAYQVRQLLSAIDKLATFTPETPKKDPKKKGKGS